MKINKKSNPNTQEVKLQTGGPMVLGEFYSFKDHETRPVTMSFLKRMAQELTDWATNQEALNLVEFRQITGIPKSSYYDFLKRCPELNQAHEYALEIIGSRREAGAIKKKYDTNAVWKRQYQFGDEYKEAMIFAAQLAKKEEAQQGGQQFIVVKEITSDPNYFKKKASDEE